MGNPTFDLQDSELIAYKARRSLYAVKDIKKNELFTKYNIKSIRPGNGLNPNYLNYIIGHKANRDIKYGEPLKSDMIIDF